MSEQSHQAEITVAEQFLPKPDDLLTGTNVMRYVLKDPAVLYEDAAAEAAQQGVQLPAAEAEAHLDGLRQTAITEVLVPEAKAHIAGEILDKLATVVENGSTDVLNAIGRYENGDDESRGKRSLRTLADELPAAINAASQLRALVENRQLTGTDPSVSRRHIRTLTDFSSDTYRRSQQGIAGAYEAKLSDGRIAKISSEDMVETTRSYSRILQQSDKELTLDPQMAYDERIIESVETRRASSLQEHGDACLSDEHDTRAKITDATNLIAHSDTLTGNLMMAINQGSVVAQELPRVSLLADVSESLGMRLRGLQDGRSSSTAGFEEELASLSRSLTKIKTVVETLMQNDRREDDSAQQVKLSANKLMSSLEK